MASLSFPAFFLPFSLWVLLISAAHSLNCTSLKFTNNKLYTNCSDLPSLNSYLHYTYNSSNSSLSIAFTAPPAKSDGWVAWAINPNGTGMAGAQALVALKSNGSLVVKTYNLVSYRQISESKLSFDVWDVSAESNTTSGNFVIFASMKVPEKTEKLNQIWQVGGSVTHGRPDKHEFQPANLKAKGTLELMASSGNTTTSGGNSTATSANSPTTSTPASSTTNSTGAGYRIRALNVGFYFAVFVVSTAVGF